MEDPREIVAKRIADLGLDMNVVSFQVGKNHSYIQQFIKYGKPQRLPEEVRIRLSVILGVDENILRGTTRATVNQNVPSFTAVTRTARTDGYTAGTSSARTAPIFFSTEKKMPVYAAAEGGQGAIIVSVDPIEYVDRPYTLEAVTDAYAILVVGDSMDPAYEPGDRAWVNPRLPPMRDMDCIFYATNGEEQKATIKRLVSWTETEWTVRQHNPRETFKLSRATWDRCHRVVGKFNR